MSYWKLDRAAARQAAVTGLREVVAIARQVGVTVGLENTNFGKFAHVRHLAGMGGHRRRPGRSRRPGASAGPGHRPCPTGRVGHGRSSFVPWRPASRRCTSTTRAAPATTTWTPAADPIDWAAIGRALAESGCTATLILESGPFESAEELRRARIGWIAGCRPRPPRLDARPADGGGPSRFWL